MILEIKGSSDISLEFKGLVLDPFLNKGFNFVILQESGKLPNLRDKWQSSLIGFDKTREHLSEKDPRDHLYLQLYEHLCFLRLFMSMSTEKHQFE